MMWAKVTEYNIQHENRAFKLKQKGWFVYMLRCSDNSLYTGITTDISRRLEEHNSEKSVTRYTRARQPVELVYQESANSRSDAGKREVQLKKLKKIEKEFLVQNEKNNL